MRLDPEMVREVIAETARQVVGEIDRDIVEAIVAEACGEATPGQLALLDFLFETEDRREMTMPDLIEDVRADALAVGDRIQMDGAVRTVTKIGRDEHRMRKDCPDCGGNSGEPPPCETCAGSGKVPDTDSPKRQAVAFDLDLTSQPTTGNAIRKHLGYDMQVRRVGTA